MASILARMDAGHRPPSTIQYAVLWGITLILLLMVVGLAPTALQQGMVCLVIAASAACVISDVVLRQRRPCPHGLLLSVIAAITVVPVLSAMGLLLPMWITAGGLLLLLGATVCGGAIAHVVRVFHNTYAQQQSHACPVVPSARRSS